MSVGSAIGGAVGAVAGFFIGGPTGAMRGFSLGYMLGSAIDPIEGPEVRREGPRLSDLKVQTSSYGLGIPDVYGAMAIAGNVIWAEPIHETVTTTAEEQGGKGGPPSQTVITTTYSYDASFAVGLCTGPIVGIRRIWADTTLIYDAASDASAETLIASGRFAPYVKVYRGTEGQLPDPTIEADKGAGNVPGHRGLAYLVFTRLPLGEFGNRIPSIRAEVVGVGSSELFVPRSLGYTLTYTSETAAAATVDGYVWARDTANPATSYLLRHLLDGSVMASVPNTSPAALTLELVGVDEIGTVLLREPSGNDAYVSNRPNGAPPAVARNASGVTLAVGRQGTFWGVSAILGGAGNQSNGMVMIEPLVHDARLTTISLPQPIAIVSGVIGATRRSDYVVLKLADASNNHRYLGRLPYYGNAVETIVDVGAGTSIREVVVSSIGDLYLLVYDGTTRIQRRTIDGVLVSQSAAITGDPVRIDEASGLLWGFYTTGGITGFWTADRDTLAITYGTASAGNNDYSHGAGRGYGRAAIVGNIGNAYHVVPLAALVAKTDAALADVIEHIAAQAGLSAGELDTSAITQAVPGYLRASPMTARAALDPLLRASALDAVESGTQIVFRRRASAVATTIPAEDLGANANASGESDAAAALTLRRVQETELPRSVAVTYLDPARDYEPNTQRASRTLGAAEGEVAVELPIALSDDAARRVADRLLWEAWVERSVFDPIRLPLKWSRLEPGDPVMLDDGVRLYRARLRWTRDHGTVFEAQAVAEEPAVYDQGASGVSGVAPTSTLGLGELARMELIDCPLLREQDNGPGLYFAAAALTAAWRGVSVLRSEDLASWSQVGALFTSTAIGTAETLLAAGTSGNTIDESKSVDVVLYAGTLSTVTEASLYAGANAALLGAELIQFRTATSLGGKRWRLTGLLRGRRGTEWAMIEHRPGDRFVLLQSEAGMVRIAGSLGDLNTLRYYRLVPFAAQGTRVPPVGFTDTGAGLKPLAPVLLRGYKTPTNDWQLAWTRRTRIGWDWVDGTDAPLGETSEAYEIDVYSGAGAGGVVNNFFKEPNPRLGTSSPNGLAVGDNVFISGTGVPELNGRAWQVHEIITTTQFRVLGDASYYTGSIGSSGVVRKRARTLTATSEAATYTAAQQTTDYGGSQSAVGFVVYQMSDTVGRGFGSGATL